MSRNFVIQMKRSNGTDYDNLYPVSASDTDVFDGYVTPQQFGAAGDGVQDDSSAMTQAIASGKAVLCSGSFLLKNVALPSSVNIHIVGANCTFVPSYSNGASGAISSAPAVTMFTGTNLGNVVFENVNFEGTYESYGTSNLYLKSLINLSGGNSCEFYNCRFKNIDGSTFATAYPSSDNSKFINTNGQVISVKGFNHTIIENCVFDSPSAMGAVWIMPNSNDMSAVSVELKGLKFYNCVGVTPLNLLCQNAMLQDIYFDSSCFYNGSAILAMVNDLTLDGLICNGDYNIVVDTSNSGRFINNSIAINNVSVDSHNAVVVFTSANNGSISNCNTDVNSLLVINHKTQPTSGAWTTTYFPWLPAQLNQPSIKVENCTINAYNAIRSENFAPLMIDAEDNNLRFETGLIYASNIQINLVEKNPLYPAVMLNGGSLSMSNSNMTGLFSYQNSTDVCYIYYNGITENMPSGSQYSIPRDSVVVNNCTFDSQSAQSSAQTFGSICYINGVITSVVCTGNNVLTNRCRYVVSGLFSRFITVNNNTLNVITFTLSYNISGAQINTQHPVFLGNRIATNPTVRTLTSLSGNPQIISYGQTYFGVSRDKTSGTRACRIGDVISVSDSASTTGKQRGFVVIGMTGLPSGNNFNFNSLNSYVYSDANFGQIFTVNNSGSTGSIKIICCDNADNTSLRPVVVNTNVNPTPTTQNELQYYMGYTP